MKLMDYAQLLLLKHMHLSRIEHKLNYVAHLTTSQFASNVKLTLASTAMQNNLLVGEIHIKAKALNDLFDKSCRKKLVVD